MTRRPRRNHSPAFKAKVVNRDEARQDVFDYIEMFYNTKRKHAKNGMLSPVEFEKQQNS